MFRQFKLEEPFNRGYYPIVGTVSQQKEIAIRRFGHMHSWHLWRQYIDYTRLDIILRYFVASGRKHYIEEKR